MSKTKINWLESYQDYLATKEMSLRDVSEKYGVSYSRVKKVSMLKRWITESYYEKKRKEYQAKQRDLEKLCSQFLT